MTMKRPWSASTSKRPNEGDDGEFSMAIHVSRLRPLGKPQVSCCANRRQAGRQDAQAAHKPSAIQGRAQRRRPVIPPRPVESQGPTPAKPRLHWYKNLQIVGSSHSCAALSIPHLSPASPASSSDPSRRSVKMDGGQSSGSLCRRPTKSPDETYKHKVPRPKEGIYMPKEPLPKQEAQAEAEHAHKPKEAQAEAGDPHQPRDTYKPYNQQAKDAAEETDTLSFQFEDPKLAIEIYKDDSERELYQKEPLCLEKETHMPGHAFLSRKSFSKEVIFPGNTYFSSIIDGAKRPLINLWDQGIYYFNMMKTAKGCYNNYSTGPGLFKYVGSETKGLLYHDYLSRSLRLEENTKYFMNVAAGSMVVHPNSVQKMMLNVNHVNTSMSLNGTVGDNWMAKFSFDGILGAQTKAVLYLPAPSFQSKIEFQSLHRFAALTGSFGTGNRPCLDVSCMLGTKLGAVGCNYKLDPATSEFNCSAGLSVQTPRTSLGLIMDQDQTFTATLHKTYPQWRTSIAVKAMFGFGGPFHVIVPRLGLDAPFFLPVARPLPHEDDQAPRRAEDSALVLGISHCVNKSLLLKSRLKSDGVAAVVVKKTFWGHISLAGSAEVDLCRLRGKPSVGLLVSVF